VRYGLVGDHVTDTPDTVEPQEMTLEDACPICEGTLQARLTPGRIWTYCPTCKRLSQPVIRRATNGAMMLYPAAAA
jgi:hypothetical protein